MRALFVLGRLIYGGFFAYSGLNHFRNQEMLSQYAEHKGVSAPQVAVPATGTMLLAGGVSIMAGVKPRQGLAAIVGFLLPTTLLMHRFWEVEDPTERMNETINFSKNMALAGAALMMLQIPEPWPASIDEARRQDEEMYVRLGGRDVCMLPIDG